jgi:hypothetical protein
MCLMLQLLTQMAFFVLQHPFFNSAEQAYMEQTDQIYSLKILRSRKFPFQKLIQFRQQNKVLEDPASNTDGFLWRDTSVSSSHLNRNIWNRSLSPP